MYLQSALVHDVAYVPVYVLFAYAKYLRTSILGADIIIVCPVGIGSNTICS